MDSLMVLGELKPQGFPGGPEVKHLPTIRKPGFDPWVGRISWRRTWQPHSSIRAWRIPRPEKPGGLYI